MATLSDNAHRAHPDAARGNIQQGFKFSGQRRTFRQQERQYISSRDLVQRLRARKVWAEYMPAFSDIVSLLKAKCRPGDLVLTMGAGDIWKVADALVQGT